MKTSTPLPPATRWLRRLGRHERLNFFLTNQVPRRLLTQAMGRLSRSRQPLLRALSFAVWRRFMDLDLSDAKQDRFDSLHDCFTRELRPGARPIDRDPAVLASPCDAVVGACGAVDGARLIQAKGLHYTLEELFAGDPDAARFRDGSYVTLRLTAAMYHRFHAPHDLQMHALTYVGGDVWNVNPAALARVPKLFCRNERAVIPCTLAAGGHRIALVPVAAILVAGIRLHAVDVRPHLRTHGVHRIACAARYAKGQEMGWFEHGSTILVFAPHGFTLAAGIAPGCTVRVGQALLRLP